MKEVEFTLSSDKKNWMDTSVISDTPNKVTIIDPRPYVNVLVDILESLQSIQDENYPSAALEHLAKASVRSLMNAIINGRRAWVNGIDADAIMHPVELKKAFGFDIDPVVRDKIRYELDFDQDALTLKSLSKMKSIQGMDKSKEAATRLIGLLQEISDLMKLHMSPNMFMIHALTNARDGRTFWLEEYSDWRIMEWTKTEQARIDSTHADV